MTETELRQAISLGREQRGTEFKGPSIPTDRHFQAKVIRAILGMANKPGGGTVVIGVDDDKRMIDLGVDGIVSDRPDLVRQAMADRWLALPPATPVQP